MEAETRRRQKTRLVGRAGLGRRHLHRLDGILSGTTGSILLRGGSHLNLARLRLDLHGLGLSLGLPGGRCDGHLIERLWGGFLLIGRAPLYVFFHCTLSGVRGLRLLRVSELVFRKSGLLVSPR